MFQILMIVIQVFACVESVWSQNWVKALYWACGSGIAFSVWLMPDR